MALRCVAVESLLTEVALHLELFRQASQKPWNPETVRLVMEYRRVRMQMLFPGPASRPELGAFEVADPS